MASNKKRNNKKTSVNKRVKKIGSPKRRKRNRKIHYILLSILAIATLITLSLTVFFKIENVIVIGNDFYSNKDIIDVANIELDKNMFLTDLKEIPETIAKEFPYIEEVYVSRKIPSTIEIVVKPSTVSVILELIPYEDYAIISETGKILERGLPLLPPDIILVKGLDIKEKLPGEYLAKFEKERIATEDSESLAEIKIEKNKAGEEQATLEADFLRSIDYLHEAIEETGFDKITNLDVSDPFNMKVNYENRITLELGTEIALEYKLRYITDALIALNKEGKQAIADDARGVLSVQNVLIENEAIFTPDENYVMVEDAEKPIEEADETNPDGTPVEQEEFDATGGEEVIIEI